MENNLQPTPDTHSGWAHKWGNMLIFSILMLFIGQTAFAQTVCTNPIPYTLVSEDAATATSNDAKIRISGALSGDNRVGFSEGTTYSGPAFATAPKFSTLTGGYISQTLATPTNLETAGRNYTIRVFSEDGTCYTDKPFVLEYVNFNTAPINPDIQVTVAKTPAGFVTLGTAVSIVITVENKGTGPATGVEYTVGIPAGLTGVTGSTATGTYSDATKKWTIGNIPVNGTYTLTLTGTVSSRGVKYVTADLTAEVETDTDSRPTTITNTTNSPGEDDFGSVCISTPFDYCSNDEYTITLPSYASIVWSKGATVITAGNAAGNGVRLNGDGSLTVFAVGEYSYSMTTGPNACPSGGCCPISVEAGKPPVLVAPTAQAICFNASFAAVTATNTQASPNGSYTYQWYSDGAVTTSVNQIAGQNALAFTAFPTAVGVYTYKLKAFETGHPNCADSITVTLEIKVLPTPTLASNTPVCEQSPINFTASPSGATAYAWSGPNGFTGSSVNNPTIASALLTSAGTYMVTVTNGVGCSATATTSLVVNPKPAAPTAIAKTFCAEDPIGTLDATALGGNFLLWYGNLSTGGTGSTSASQHNPTIAGLTSYYVSQTVTSTGCESNRSELVVTVNAKPVPPTTAPVSACQNSTPITLTVSGSNTGLTVLWYGLNSTGGTGSTTADIAPTLAVGTTTYYVSRKDDITACESNRATIPVEIRVTPVPTLASNSPVCVESPINLTAGPAGATTYTWSGPSGFIGSNITNPTIASAVMANGGTYAVTVTNGTGCFASTSVVVVVNPLPAIPAVTAKTFCAEDAQAGLVATALSGNHVLWYGNASSGGVGSTVIPTHNPTIAGLTSYFASQVDDVTGCESHRNELVVNVNPKPAPPLAANVTYCQGVAAIPLTVSGAALHTFLWYGTDATGGTSSTTAPTPLTNAVGTTTYYVSQKDNTTGCESNRDDAIATVNSTPVAPTVAQVTYCQTATATSLTASAAGGNSLVWYNGGSTTSTAPTPLTTTAGLTYFYVSQVIPGTGCESGMSGIPVTVNPLPVAEVIAVNSLCIGTVTQNNAKLILTRYRNSDQVSWNIGSTYVVPPTSTALATVPAGGIFASSLPNPTLASPSQDYSVKIENSFGCSVIRKRTLTYVDCGCPGGYCEPATVTKTK